MRRTLIEDLLLLGRRIWGDERMMATDVGIAMGTVHGDICRAIRDRNKEELQKEMGNMLLSTVRWADDLGLDIDECLEAAERCQRAFRAARRT